jgi:hypothetical protein
MCQFVKLKVFKLFGVSFALFVTYSLVHASFPNFNFDYRCHDDKNDRNRKWGYLNIMPASHFDVKPMTDRPKSIVRHSTIKSQFIVYIFMPFVHISLHFSKNAYFSIDAGVLTCLNLNTSVYFDYYYSLMIMLLT